MVCLAAHGSAWLAQRDNRGTPPALDQDNSTFQFVGSLRFHLAKGGWRRPEVTAGDVATWLPQLGRRKVDRLRLRIPEAAPVTIGDSQVGERMLAGFPILGP